jgi:uncharacterized damage-inducible protein DinB
MTPEQIRLLYEFNAWANRRVLDACAPLTPEQFTRNMGSSFSSVRDTLVHIMGGEWIWSQLWMRPLPDAKLTLEEFRAERFPDLASVRKRWEGIESGMLQFAAGVTPEALDHVIEYTNVRGNRFAYPLRAMMQHVVNHSTYHRGQMCTLLRQLGANPRATDYLRYLDVLAGNPED